MNTKRFTAWLTALALAGGAVLLLGLSGPLFVGKVFMDDDLSAFHLPYRFFYSECLKHGTSFLWDPHTYCGFYIHGDGQIGMCHPLHWLLYRFLPLTTAFDLEVVWGYPLMLAGMFLLLRRWRAPTHVAVFGALLYTFGGHSVSYHPYMQIIEIMAHTPALLWLIDIAMRSKSWRTTTAASLGVAILSGSQHLLGYPQATMLSSLFEGIYALVLIPYAGRRSNLVLLFAAKVLGAALGAVQIIPTLHAGLESIRTVPGFEAERMSMSLLPANVLQLLNPYLFNRRVLGGPEFCGPYGGAAATALVAWLVVRFRYLGRMRGVVVVLAAMAVLNLWLGFGKYGHLYALITNLPGIGLFRTPVRHLLLFHLAWVLLAVIAYAKLSDELLSSKEPTGERQRWGTLTILGVVSAATVTLAVGSALVQSMPGLLPEALVGQLAPIRNVFAGAALVVGAAALTVAAARGHRWALVGLTLLTLVDLAWYGLRTRPADTLDGFLARVATPNASTEYRLAPDRRPVYWYNGPMMKGFRMADGYCAIPPKRFLSYYTDPVALCLAGVRWVHSRYGATTELADAARRGVEWVEIPDPMPRVRLVADALVSTDWRKDLDRIDMARTVLFDRPAGLEGGIPGTARIVTEEPGDLTIHTSAATRQALVLADAFDDDWTMTINGVPAEILRAYGDFMGSVLPPGDCEVRFRFVSKSFAMGKRISLVSLGLVILLGLIPLPHLFNVQRRSEG